MKQLLSWASKGYVSKTCKYEYSEVCGVYRCADVNYSSHLVIRVL